MDTIIGIGRGDEESWIGEEIMYVDQAYHFFSVL